MKIREGSPFRHQEEAEPVPPLEKFAPPRKVQVKFLVQTNGMIITSESAQKGNHATEEGTALWSDLACMMEVANKGL